MVAIVRLIERFSGLIGFLGAWVMLPLIVSMVYEVLARHFFNAPTFWAYEVGYMLAGTTYMFGMGYCLRQGATRRQATRVMKFAIRCIARRIIPAIRGLASWRSGGPCPTTIRIPFLRFPMTRDGSWAADRQ